MSAVLSCGRADGSAREGGSDQAEVSRGRSTSRDQMVGWEGLNVKWGQESGTARAGHTNRSHPAERGPGMGGDGAVR